MQIQSAYPPSFSAGASHSAWLRQIPPSSSASAADSVTISTAGRAALSSEYPLEYYSMPQWLGDLMPVVVSGKLGGKAVEGGYEKGGHLVGKHDAEIGEYGALLSSHLKNIMQKEGIATLPEYHQAMIVDKDNSERVRQMLKENIAGDARMLALMRILEVPVPD